MTLRRVLLLLAALGLALLAAGLAGEATRRVVVARVTGRVAQDASLRQALLASEIARFRLLPRALADDRDLVAAVPGGSARARAALDRKLERLAREFGAAAIYAIGRDGRAFAASNWNRRDSFVGRDYGFRPYVREAQARGSGRQFALGTASRRPGLYLATRADGGAVLVVKLEFDRVEAQWRGAQGLTWVTDPAGVILVTSQPGWRFAATAPITPERRLAEQALAGVPALGPAPFRRTATGLDVASGTQGAGRKADYLAVTTAPDAMGWRLTLAVPMAGAVEAPVRIAQGIAALVALLLFASTAGLVERRRQRRARTVELETAVAERTAALRHEMAERAAAEDHAAALREGLRQANRLATLGQVTASVAHETAQPVAAIRTYATTTARLLDRGAEDDVRANLAAIARLADRIGAITAHLRGFARKGTRGGTEPVALAGAIEGARLILKEQLARIALVAPEGIAGLAVEAEKVRLEQVLVILLQNAAEALVPVRDPAIFLTVAAHQATVTLTVADNGPGIAPDIAARLFTPFATSRAMGLGLGLVIARDIVEEFGGTLDHAPAAGSATPAGGACFVLTLPKASP